MRPPAAVLDISPETEYTTQTDITFDASRSSDIEGVLSYRWDLDDDGIWDTGFSQTSTLVHRFDTAGTKFITLQVKDSAGWVSKATLSINVIFEPDPGSEPGQPHPGLVLQFPVTDAAFDPYQPYVYVSSKEQKRVYFVNLETGIVEKQFDFDWMPEYMAITPDGARLFVALLTREHDPDWQDEAGHEGYIASFDLEQQVKDRKFWIPEDPFGLVAMSNGHLVVSSGSGQETYIRVIDGMTGALLGSSDQINQRNRLTLHPAERIVYAAETSGAGFSDMKRYDVDETGNITYRWDNFYPSSAPAGTSSPRLGAITAWGGNGNALFTAVNTDFRAGDVDGGTCILESPTWYIDEPKALSLWYFHGQRDANDDPNGDDLFSLEVSTDGGASYTPLISIGDVRTTAAWTNATTNISAGMDVKLRIQVSDGPGGSGAGDIIEAGLDDVMLCPAN